MFAQLLWSTTTTPYAHNVICITLAELDESPLQARSCASEIDSSSWPFLSCIFVLELVLTHMSLLDPTSRDQLNGTHTQ